MALNSQKVTRVAAQLVFLLGICGCGGTTLERAWGTLLVNDVEAGPEVEVVVPFGEVFEGRDAELEVEVRNAGRAPFTLLSVDLTDTTGTFELVDLVGTTVGPGESQQLVVTFRPPQQSPQQPMSAFEATVDITASGTRAGGERIRLRLTGTSVDEGCEVPGSLDFGIVAIGSSHERDLRLTNHASSPRRAGEARLEPRGDGALFSLLDQRQEVAPGGERLLSVTFWPAESRSYEATAIVAAFEGCPDQRVALIGQGRDQVVVAEPLDFNFVPVGAERTLTLEVQNLGPSPVALTKLKLNGAGADVFRVGPDLEEPLEIPPRSARTVELTCQPLTEQRHDAVLWASTGLEPQPEFSVPVLCHGGGPRLVTEPEEVLDFGKVAWVKAGTKPVYQVRTLNLRNMGTSYTNLGDERLYLGENRSPPYFEVETANENTEPGEFEVTLAGDYNPSTGIYAQYWLNTLPLQVRLTPRSVGIKEAELVVRSNDFHRSVVRIRLRADAAEYTPCSYTVEPSALDFGRVTPGTQRQLAFVVRNQGTDPLDVCLLSNLHLEPASDAAFSLTDGPVHSLELAPGEVLELEVSAAPALPGPSLVTALAGAVSFHVSSPDEPMPRVPLTGQAGKSCLVISPTKVEFGAVDPGCGTPKLQLIEVRNTCPDDVVLDSVVVTSGAPEFGLIGLPDLSAGITLRPHLDALKFHVSFLPSQEGPENGWLNITWTDPGGTAVDVLAFGGAGDEFARQIDEYAQGDGVVDILIQIANSQDDEAYLVADYHSRAEVLVEHLLDLGIDFRLGAVGSLQIQTSAFSYQGGSLLSPPSSPDKVLHPGSVGLIAQAQNKLDHYYNLNAVYAIFWGWMGDPTKSSVMRASRDALSAPMLSSVNAGFIRAPARLGVLHVNQHDRGVWGLTNEPAKWEQPSEYLADFVAAKGAGRESDVVFGAFTAVRWPCSPLDEWGPTFDDVFVKRPDYAENMTWLYYRWLAEATGGYLAQFCIEPGWEDETETMAEVLSGVRLRFPLSQAPDFSQDPLEVQVNGVSVAATTTGGQTVWQYDSSRNRVKFGLDHMPPKGTTVTLKYKTACP